MANVPLEDLLKLSVSERIQLAEDLWDSIAAESETLPLTEAQKSEVDRRLDSHSRDAASSLPWDEVRERLHKRFE